MRRSHKRNRRLACGAVLTGATIVVLLLLALNRGPLARGFVPDGGSVGVRAFCPWCKADQPITLTDVLGSVLISLVIFALPASHLALLIMLAARVSRPPKFSDLEHAFHCPHCNHPLVKQWRNCPYCGLPIERTPTPSQ